MADLSATVLRLLVAYLDGAVERRPSKRERRARARAAELLTLVRGKLLDDPALATLERELRIGRPDPLTVQRVELALLAAFRADPDFAERAAELARPAEGGQRVDQSGPTDIRQRLDSPVHADNAVVNGDIRPSWVQRNANTRVAFTSGGGSALAILLLLLSQRYGPTAQSGPYSCGALPEPRPGWSAQHERRTVDDFDVMAPVDRRVLPRPRPPVEY